MFRNLNKFVFIFFFLIFAYACNYAAVTNNSTANYSKYPQNTPKIALFSYIQAVDDSDINYVFKHLIDPKESSEVKENQEKTNARLKAMKQNIVQYKAFKKDIKDGLTTILFSGPYAFMISKRDDKQIVFRNINRLWYLSYDIGF